MGYATWVLAAVLATAGLTVSLAVAAERPPAAGTIEVKLGQTIARTLDHVKADNFGYGPKQDYDARTDETHIYLPYGDNPRLYAEARGVLTDPRLGSVAVYRTQDANTNALLTYRLHFDKPIGAFRFESDNVEVGLAPDTVAGIEYSQDGKTWKTLHEIKGDAVGAKTVAPFVKDARAADLNTRTLFIRIYTRDPKNPDASGPGRRLQVWLAGDPSWGDAATTFAARQQQVWVTPAKNPKEPEAKEPAAELPASNAPAAKQPAAKQPAAGPASAGLQMTGLFGDNMVLQQGIKAPVWGLADPGAKVVVEFAGQRLETAADQEGRWKVALEPLQASAEPREMTIASGKDTMTIKGVLVGEVWLDSGQSNMELPMSGVQNAAAETAAANYPLVRFFNVPKVPAGAPLDRCGGAWAVCSPQTVGATAALGYFFVRDIHKTMKVPVGLINASWGGTMGQPWTPLAAMKSLPSLTPSADQFEQKSNYYTGGGYAKDQDAAWQKFDETNAEWLAGVAKDDPGLAGKWFDPQAKLDGWRSIRLPNSTTGDPWHFLGVVWLRKEVEVPQAWVGKDLALRLGVIDEADTTYVNGTEVGAMWAGKSGRATTPREYAVPAALVKSTKVVIAVRVMNLYSFGGLMGPASKMTLSLKDKADERPVSLVGAWQSKTAEAIDRLDIPRPENMPVPFFPDVNLPSALYNGMIAPVVPYAIRGAIWYQAESNSGQPDIYRDLFPAMITAWRQAWGQGDFAFDFVQLPNSGRPQQGPIEPRSGADIRGAQAAALALPNTGMAVTIDIGEPGNVHPRNKQDVGKRLVAVALANTYGQKIEGCGPLYRSMKVADARIRLTFDHVGGGMVAKGGGDLVGFAVAGDDKVFHVAQAKIEGAEVVVSSDKVAAPVAVRYAWASNPFFNLYNKEGLPAAPFRTDTWTSQEIKAAPGEKFSAPAAP